jgi:hypothetical protein
VAEQASSDLAVEPVSAAVLAEITPLITDAVGHIADALPELLVLARGGKQFETRVRPYLNEAIHCLASALEGCLIASPDAERAGMGPPRKAGEDAVAIILRDFLDRAGA